MSYSSDDDLTSLTARSHSESDSGDVTIKELYQFNKRLDLIPFGTLLNTSRSILWDTLMIAFPTVGTQIINSAGLIMMNFSGDTAGQAALGIALSYGQIFYFGFFISLVDKLGIDLSVNFGRKNYLETKKVLNQGAITAIGVFLLYTLPAFAFGKNVLVLVRVSPTDADNVQKILNVYLIAVFIQTISSLFKTHCMSQGHETIFGWPYLLIILSSIGSGHVFINIFKLGPVGWVFSKIIYEICCLGFDIWVTITKTHTGTFGLVPFSSTKVGLLDFFWTSVKFAFGSSSEFLGYEITSYFTFRSQNQAEIAAYSSVFNFAAIFYGLGDSLAVISRTRMNLMIGKNLKQTSKNFFQYFMVACFLYGIVVSLVLLLSRSYLIHWYASANKTLTMHFSSLLNIYCVFIPLDLNSTHVYMGMKSIGSINYMVFLNVIFLLGLNFAGGYFMTTVLKMNVTPLFFLLLFMESIQLSLCVKCVLEKDWQSIRAEEEEFVAISNQKSDMDRHREDPILQEFINERPDDGQ